MSILNFKNVKISGLTDFIGLGSCVFGVSSNQICAALEKQFLILTASHVFHYFFFSLLNQFLSKQLFFNQLIHFLKYIFMISVTTFCLSLST